MLTALVLGLRSTSEILCLAFIVPSTVIRFYFKIFFLVIMGSIVATQKLMMPLAWNLAPKAAARTYQRKLSNTGPARLRGVPRAPTEARVGSVL